MQILLDRYPGGKIKALTMSYDDGQIHDRRLVEIFNKNGIKGTFHLNSGRFDTPNFVSEEEVAALYTGHEISCHTLTHPHLELLRPEGVLAEIQEDRRRLEQLAGYVVRGMSYPYGSYTRPVIELLRAAGMEYSRTTAATRSFGLPADFMEWHPTCHHRDCLSLLDAFLQPPHRNTLQLFYVWGHSYEFDRNGNWDLIERFCESAAHQEDVWYATNIEIKDYLCALRALRLSQDSTMLYNPTALDLWVSADRQPLCVPAGQTVRL